MAAINKRGDTFQIVVTLGRDTNGKRYAKQRHTNRRRIQRLKRLKDWLLNLPLSLNENARE